MPHAETYTEFRPSEYPPFPSSPDFPTVELSTISLQKILAHDAAEEERVLEACMGRGFFYLDLAGPEAGETILQGAEDVVRVAERFMTGVPEEEKLKYAMRDGVLFGWVIPLYSFVRYDILMEGMPDINALALQSSTKQAPATWPSSSTWAKTT